MNIVSTYDGVVFVDRSYFEQGDESPLSKRIAAATVMQWVYEETGRFPKLEHPSDYSQALAAMNRSRSDYIEPPTEWYADCWGDVEEAEYPEDCEQWIISLVEQAFPDDEEDQEAVEGDD
jgi:hypothetical protein